MTMPDTSMLGADRSAMIGGDIRTAEGGLGALAAFGDAGAQGAFRRVLDESVAAADQADLAAANGEDLAAANGEDLVATGSAAKDGAAADGADAGTVRAEAAGAGTGMATGTGMAAGTGGPQAGAPRTAGAEGAREPGEPDTERSLAPPPGANDESVAVETATAGGSADGPERATRSQAARLAMGASRVGTLPSPAPEDGSDGAEEVVLANDLHLAGADRLAAEHLRHAAEKAQIGEEGLSGGQGEGELAGGASGGDPGAAAAANERGTLGAAAERARESTGVTAEISGDPGTNGGVEAGVWPAQGETKGLVGRRTGQGLSGQGISGQGISGQGLSGQGLWGAMPGGDPRAAERASSAGNTANTSDRGRGAEDCGTPLTGQKGPRKGGPLTGAQTLEEGAGSLGSDAAAQAAAQAAAAQARREGGGGRQRRRRRPRKSGDGRGRSGDRPVQRWSAGSERRRRRGAIRRSRRGERRWISGHGGRGALDGRRSARRGGQSGRGDGRSDGARRRQGRADGPAKRRLAAFTCHRARGQRRRGD
jgi:hypothetical protein